MEGKSAQAAATVNTSDKMGNMSIPKLLFGMSLPAMFSMLVQALYNIVDSVFVARISQDALTALTLAFPMQMVVTAFAIGTGVGINSLVARKLGEGDKETASQVAQLGLMLALIIAVFFAGIGYVTAKYYIALFTSDANIYEMGFQYLAIVMTFSFGQCIEVILNKTLQATGNMLTPMISMLCGTVTNIVLDPILIFGYLGAPAMGIRGAAIATVIGQIVALLVTLVVLIFRKQEIHIFFRKGFRPTKENFIGIMKVGVPSIILNAIGSITTTVMNAILIVYSNTAVAVYGAFYKLQSFAFMPIFGLNQGSMPIMGYNYGAHNRKRFVAAFKLALAVAVLIMCFATALFMAIPNLFLMLFNADVNMMSIGERAFRMLSLGFIPAAFSVIYTAMFTSVGFGTRSMLLMLLRQLILCVPFIYLLGRLFGLDYLWLGYGAAELISAIAFTPVAVYTYRKIFPGAKTSELFGRVRESIEEADEAVVNPAESGAVAAEENNVNSESAPYAENGEKEDNNITL